MKKQKIFINADCSIHAVNAQERHGKHWTLFLDKEKYEITIFASGEPDPRLTNLPSVRIKRISTRQGTATIQIVLHLILHRWDILLNAKNGWRDLLLLRLTQTLKRRIKFVTLAVNQVPYFEKGSRRTKIADAILFGSDQLMSNSSRGARTIRDYRNVDVPVLNNIYDLSLFKPEAHTNKRRKVYCVGSMVAVKQPFLFANIAREIPEADFIWIGARYYFDDMKQKASEENIRNLSLPGEIPNNELPKLLANGDLFLFPSMHEGFPNAVVEAMACGLPVIVLDRYGPEAVVDGETGYIAHSEFELLARVKELLRDDSLLEQFSKNARARAKKYEGSIGILQLESILDSL